MHLIDIDKPLNLQALGASFDGVATDARRRILSTIAQAQLPAQEIAQMVGLSPLAFSRQATKLWRAGLVVEARLGRTRQLTINHARWRSVASWLKLFVEPRAAGTLQPSSPELSALMHGLADERRLRLMLRLRLEGPLGLGAISEAEGLPRYVASRQIKTLAAAGLVTKAAQGRQRSVCVNPEALSSAVAYFVSFE